MSFLSDLLTQLSAAISTRAEAAKHAVVAVRVGGGGFHLTGMLWQIGVVVVSEQALPSQDELELVAPDGLTVAAKLAGRDASTNIAILKTANSIAAPAFAAAEAHVGALALAIGANGTGAATGPIGYGQSGRRRMAFPSRRAD